MKNLLLTGAFNYTNKQLNDLKNLGYNVIFIQDERVPLTIDLTNIHAVVCNSLFLYNDIKDFKNLSIIQLTSAGMERVPINYINEKGIKLFNARGVYSIPISEWVILKILEIYKKSSIFYKNQQKHLWNKQRDLFELTDKTVAIIGLGSVGIEVAKRLKAFGVKIIGVDIKIVESEYVDKLVLLDDINKVLEISDIIILTLPLTKGTRHLLNSEKFEIMKDNSVIINVARGGIIDENSLIKTLQDGKIMGVALDVFEEEPLGENSLWDFNNVIITPHNSFVSEKNSGRLFNLIFENLEKRQIK